MPRLLSQHSLRLRCQSRGKLLIDLGCLDQFLIPGLLFPNPFFVTPDDVEAFVVDCLGAFLIWPCAITNESDFLKVNVRGLWSRDELDENCLHNENFGRSTKYVRELTAC